MEKPHKRSGPVQCMNCQEYGHTKRYCKLPTVCVVCGELHNSADCKKEKSDRQARNCSNCGGNHTANYRGCPVYANIKTKFSKQANIPLKTSSTSTSNVPPNPQSEQSPFTNIASYASILKTKTPADTQCSDPTESALEKLTQTLNSFMTTMQNMMQQMLTNQTMLIQALMKNQ